MSDVARGESAVPLSRPAAYPLAFGDGIVGRLFVHLNDACTHLSEGLLSYQIIMVGAPYPSTDYLLHSAEENTVARVAAL